MAFVTLTEVFELFFPLARTETITGLSDRLSEDGKKFLPIRECYPDASGEILIPAGADGVDPNLSARVLQGQDTGQILHASLAHRIAEEPRLGNALMYAGYVDDNSGFA